MLQDNQCAHICKLSWFNWLIECSVILTVWLSRARNRSWFFVRMIIERLIADLLGIEWFFASSNQQRMMGKCDRQIMNMLSFVMKITKKSLYTSLNMFVSIKRLWSSNKDCRHNMIKVRRIDFLRAMKLWTDIYIWLTHEL